jgi:hypothetical protein
MVSNLPDASVHRLFVDLALFLLDRQAAQA